MRAGYSFYSDSKKNSTRQNTHTLSHDACDAQRAFAFAAQEKSSVVHWETIEIVGNEREIGQRHRISKKRLRRFECSFKGPDAFVDSDIFETREVVHAKMVACRLARERGAKPLLDTFRAASA